MISAAGGFYSKKRIDELKNIILYTFDDFDRQARGLFDNSPELNIEQKFWYTYAIRYCMAKIHQRYDEYEASIKILHELKSECSRREEHVRKIKVQYLLGMAHFKGHSDYAKALRYFKKTLFYVWTLNSSSSTFTVPPQHETTMKYY